MRFWKLLQSGKQYLAIVLIVSILFTITRPAFAQDASQPSGNPCTGPVVSTTVGAAAGSVVFPIVGTAVGAVAGYLWSGGFDVQACVVYVLTAPVTLLGYILHYELDTLITVLNYQTHNNNWIISAVYDTWYIIRNFINMFFIIIMIVMALATVLSYEKYSYKKLLGPLLITALIINFSFTVGQNFIIFGNELAITFAKQININNLGNLFMESTGIYRLPPTKQYDKILPTSSNNAPSPILNALIGELFFIIYGIIAILAIATVLVTSIIRIPALWIILIYAPVAWLGYAMPNMKSGWDRWWKELTSWTFFLPIYMLCLIFAFGFLSAKTTFNFGGQSGTGIAYTLNDLFFYILTLAAFVGGLGLARSLAGSMGVGATVGFDRVEKFFGVSQQQLQQGKGFGGQAVRLVGTLGQEQRFKDIKAGLGKAYDARINVIKEKGLFGIPGTEQSKLRQARIAERYSGGLLKGTEDKAVLDAVASNRTRISKLLESQQGDEAKKKFLESYINSNDKIASQAARLEYAKKYNDISKIKEDLNAVGGKDTAVGKELLDIYKKKLDDPKVKKEQKLEILKGEAGGPYAGLPKDFVKEVAKDLYETGQIRNKEDYDKAKELFKDSEKELKALNSAINKINPIIIVESDINNAPETKGLSKDEKDIKIIEKLQDVLKNKAPRDIADFDESFWKDTNAQKALRTKMTDPNTGANFVGKMNKAMNSDRVSDDKYEIFETLKRPNTP